MTTRLFHYDHTDETARYLTGLTDEQKSHVIETATRRTETNGGLYESNVYEAARDLLATLGINKATR